MYNSDTCRCFPQR
ncbi:MAG: hypothetical protein E7291_08255 [Lachnospiraceae bacterium]|nr:hypothetical protein [Lachnospiraceae bacterium]